LTAVSLVLLHDGFALGVPKAAASKSAAKMRNIRLKMIS